MCAWWAVDLDGPVREASSSKAMRTFPRELARFRELVEERGARTRECSFDALREAAIREGARNQPVVIATEKLAVESRAAEISTWVRLHPNGTLGVVLQGFMEARLRLLRFLGGKNVALDGFHKHPDGTVSAMPDDELCQFE